MSINKKTLLGRKPEELGIKDAVHVAVVSLRAGQFLEPGQNITLNKEREAVAGNSDSFGVVDPFLSKSVKRGESFYGLLRMHEVPNVRHVWDHPEFTFEKPDTQIRYNEALVGISEDLGISYEELISACDKMYNNNSSTEYNGKLDEKEFNRIAYDKYELWSNWAEEFGIEFENQGTACCPEYYYPDFPFKYVKKV